MHQIRRQEKEEKEKKRKEKNTIFDSKLNFLPYLLNPQLQWTGSNYEEFIQTAHNRDGEHTLSKCREWTEPWKLLKVYCIDSNKWNKKL